MNYIENDTPSMDNIYNSQFFIKTKNYEQSLANNSYNKAKYPFKTGVVPSPAYSSMFAQPTDFNQPIHNSHFDSLSGQKIPIENFKHSNMQHFLRKGITQNTNLDNPNFQHKFGYNDYKTRKTEVETFFQPTTDLTYIKGMDNNTDFILDRTNVPKVQNNFNPIASIRVAPGLNKGFTSSGSGGFHQPDTLLFSKPKDKNELRPITDQRNSIFEIPIQAPPKNIVLNRGIVQPFDKNKPETTYKLTEDNWFKGQSYLKKDTNRPNENLKDTARIGSHINYYGSLKNQQEQFNDIEDYGRNSVIVYNTNKHELSKLEVPVANFSSTIKAFIAPITDALKISIKEFFLHPPREFGNISPQQPEKATTYDPVNHILKTTIKETTINDNDTGILTGNKETYSTLNDIPKKTTKETSLFETQNNNLSANKETYSSLYDLPKTTIKETNIHDEHIGNIKGNFTSYLKNNDKTKTTIKQTIPSIDTTRNINNVLYKSTYVYDPSIVAKTTLKQTTVNGCNSSSFGFIGGYINKIIGAYINKNNNAKNTQRQSSHIQYDGSLKSAITFVPMDRDAALNAEIDGTRELLLIKAAHTPNGAGNFSSVNKNDINLSYKKQIDLYEEQLPTTNANKIYQITPLSINNEAITKTPEKENAFNERLDSSILSSLIDNENAIKINPII